MKIKVTPIFTMMTKGHGNIKSYLHRFKIIESPTCLCGTTEQTIHHLIFQCELLGKERDKLISGVSKTDYWPLSNNRMISEYFIPFSKFIQEQVREENPILYSHKTQLNIKLSLLQYYNNMFRPKLSAILKMADNLGRNMLL